MSRSAGRKDIHRVATRNRLSSERLSTPQPGARMHTSAASLATVILADTRLTFQRQQDLAERALAQVDDTSFFRTIDEESNSIAVIVKHVGGNLRSRFTDFLTSDGEKPDRDRDGEFVAGDTSGRAEITAIWHDGWRALFDSLDALGPDDLTSTVYIRGEAMTVTAALQRALAHVSQHVGQIVLLAKHFRAANWKTLSIPRGHSRDWRPD